MSDMRNRVLWLLANGFIASVVSAEEPTPAQVKHFETNIRPVLVEHCQKCHGAEKEWGNLRLDSTAAMLKGGDTGPAIVLRQA